MIVVDSSALVAILDGEDDAAHYAEAIVVAHRPLLSAATLVEAGIVMLNRYGPKGVAKLHKLIQEAGIEVASVDADHARLALEAFASYGKGRKKGAGLNYGDCFSYALAKATGFPLLFKGNDFPKTDIKPLR